MYQVGDKVMHRREGACYITQIKDMDMNNTQKKYFVLEPILNEKTYIYVSIDGKKQNNIRPVIDEKKLKESEAKLNVSEDEWIIDAKARTRKYTSIVSEFDFDEVLNIYKSLVLQNEKKSLAAQDKDFLFSSEKIICSEIAILRDLEYDQVLQKIKELILTD